jgi:hypothetical protein
VGNNGDGRTVNLDNDCSSGFCYSDPNNNNCRCSITCNVSSQCGSGEICTPIDYSNCTPNMSMAVPCGAPIELVRGCMNWMHGGAAVGAQCTTDMDCRSDYCDLSVRMCTDTCATDRDCPATHRCKTLPGYFFTNEITNFCVVKSG